MKKFVVLLLVSSVVLALVSCDKTTSSNAEIEKTTEIAPNVTVSVPNTTMVQSVVCQNCSKVIAQEDAVCHSCYAAVHQEKVICPACNAEITKDSRFCNQCGSAIDAVTQTTEEQIYDGMTQDINDYLKLAKAMPSKYPMLDDTLYKTIDQLKSEGHQLVEDGDKLIFNSPDPLKPNAIYMKPLSVDVDIDTRYPVAIFSSAVGCEIIEGVEVGCDKSTIDAVSLIAEPLVLRQTADWSRYRYNFNEFYMYVTTQTDQSEIVRSIALHPKGYPPLPGGFEGEEVFYHENTDDELLQGIDLAGAFLMKYKRLLDTGRFDVVDRNSSDVSQYIALVPKSITTDSITFYFGSTNDLATPMTIKIGGSTASPYVELFDNIYMGGQREVYDQKFGAPAEVIDIDDTYYQCTYYVTYHYKLYELKFVYFKDNDANAYVYITDMYKLPF